MTSESNCVKNNKDRNTLSAAQISGMDSGDIRFVRIFGRVLSRQETLKDSGVAR